jgi:hypothetical protein
MNTSSADNNDAEIVIDKGIPIPPLHIKRNWEDLPIAKALLKMEIDDSFEVPEKLIKGTDITDLCRKLQIKITQRTNKATGKVRIWRVPGTTAPKKVPEPPKPPKLTKVKVEPLGQAEALALTARPKFETIKLRTITTNNDQEQP